MAGIAALADQSLGQLAVMTASVASLVLGAVVVARRPRLGIALGAVGATLLAWVVGKVLLAIGLGGAPLLFIGISYLLVKAWSLYKDVIDGKVEAL